MQTYAWYMLIYTKVFIYSATWSTSGVPDKLSASHLCSYIDQLFHWHWSQCIVGRLEKPGSIVGWLVKIEKEEQILKDIMDRVIRLNCHMELLWIITHMYWISLKEASRIIQGYCGSCKILSLSLIKQVIGHHHSVVSKEGEGGGTIVRYSRL